MEEKSNKILEVLLSSASATEILTGKVLGVAMLTLTVLVAWGGLGLGALSVFQPQYAGMVGSILLQSGMLFWFVAFMVGGYLMYAVLFAAIGSFCETPRDAQTLMGPIMMVLVVPILFMSMALQSPDNPIVRILSWIPFFAPFLMMARIPSDPPLFEVVGSMVTMFAFALLMVWVAGRAFRAGAPVGCEAELEGLRRRDPGRGPVGGRSGHKNTVRVGRVGRGLHLPMRKHRPGRSGRRADRSGAAMSKTGGHPEGWAREGAPNADRRRQKRSSCLVGMGFDVAMMRQFGCATPRRGPCEGLLGS